MDRDFLNKVEFERDVKIKQPRNSKRTDHQPEEEVRIVRKRTIQAKILRLIFFLVTVFALLWVGKYSVEAVYCSLANCEHKSMGQIYHEYKDFKAEKTADHNRRYGIQGER
jgi:hypothetical protein